MHDEEFHFGRWLKRKVEDQGMSQREFAEHAGVSFPALRLWINSKRPNPQGFRLVLLARALGIPREEIEQKLEEAGGAKAHAA